MAEMLAIIIRIDQTFVITSYVPPTSPPREIQSLMKKIRSVCHGPRIIMGDLNARYIRRDKRSNTRGNALTSWADKWEWNISPATSPTFCTMYSKSNFDIFVHRGINIKEKAWIPYGTWTGSNDHYPVVLSIPETRPGEKLTRRVSRKRWTS